MNKSAFLLLASLCLSVKAQWKKNDSSPLALAAGAYEKFDVNFSTDDAGNTYYVWTDFRSGDGLIYVQKLDRLGNAQFAADGLQVGKAVSGKNFSLTAKQLLPLKNGGLAVLYQEILNPGNPSEKALKLAKVSANGQLQDNRMVIESLINSDINNAVMSMYEDDSGTIRVLSNVYKNAGTDPIIKSDITPTSTFTGGTLITADQQGSKAFFNGENHSFGILLKQNGTEDFKAAGFDIFGVQVQELTSFLNNNPAGSSRIDDYYNSNGYTYIGRTITYGDGRKRVIAQKLDQQFANQWKNGGVVLGTDAAFDIHVGENANGGGIAAWIEPNLTDTKMMAAGISPTGDVLWQKPVFKTQPGKSYFTPHKFASDGKGGCYVMWFTSKAVGFDMSIQHLDADGNMLWGEAGKSIGDFKWYGVYRLVPHQSGGVVAYYTGNKENDINNSLAYDLYTTYIAADGTFGIQQKPEVSLLKNTYCPGETLAINQIGGDYQAEIQLGETWTALRKEGNNFYLPYEISGAHSLRFKDQSGGYSELLEIEISVLKKPSITAERDYKCEETDEALTLKASCERGNLLWSSGETTGEILVSPAATTVFTAVCNLEGCNASETGELEFKVIKVAAKASTDKNAYLEGEVLKFTASGGATYNWTGPNGFTSMQQNPSIEKVALENAGNYEVSVTSSEGCFGTATTAVIVNKVLANNSEKKQAEVYPNPATKWLKVRDYTEVKEVNAINMQGKITHLPYDPYSGMVYMERLNAGEYVLQLSRFDGTSKFLKIIKLQE